MAKDKAKPGSRGLGRYAEKRDFSKTAEPRARKAAKRGNGFVVQKHSARRLHYDLRLELDGVLLSFAVTRGPSLVPAEKRLAVQTEDHPVQYLDFEGTIPKGEYGGGAMIVWDRGTWEAVGDPHFGLKKGHLEFTLDGERLKGRWHLVRLRQKRGERQVSWLLIKADDEFAKTPDDEDILETYTGSVSSGRTVEELLAEGDVRADHKGRETVKQRRKTKLPDASRIKGAKKGILPPFVEPMLATASPHVPRGANWLHEIKFDGYRVQARVDGTSIQMFTRKGLDWTGRFLRVARAVTALGLASALIDGEIVVEDMAGISNFSDLQEALSEGQQERLVYYVFDLLYLDGVDLRGATLADRKALLRAALADAPDSGIIRFADHIEDHGPSMFDHACRLGLEGIVSKRADQPHRSGRSDHWVKSKCVHGQEFVVVGYVPSTAAKRSVGSLALGYYDKGGLAYAGRAGTGFSASVAASLAARLEDIRADRPKFVNTLLKDAEKGVRWVRPETVAEIEFRGWTGDKLLRQAAYKGIREDKDPKEVVAEGPPEGRKSATDSELDGARLTHPERLLWPDRGITKRGLAEFYAEIADWVLPHIAGRPLSMVRCPQGIAEKCFFAKHAWAGLDDTVQRVDLGKDTKALVIRDLDGLLALVQAGTVEIHPWGAMADDAERPDRITFDLDPGEGVGWDAVVAAALEVRDRLAALGLESFVKTSGGKGLHVVLPLVPKVDWEAGKAFAKSIADRMAKDMPDRFVSGMAKSIRTERIFIDYLRNGRGATAVAPYSTRARAGAPVSTPLAWDELSLDIKADHFTIENLRRRLDHLKTDPWAAIGKLKQTLPDDGALRSAAKRRAPSRKA